MNTTANKITVLRIILVPVFMVLLYLGQTYWALAVYIIACVSDFVDGKIARKYNQITDFGKFMDPLADKMLVLAAMCYFVEVGLIPGWVVAVVLLREFGVSGLRLLAVEQGIVIAAAWSGKIKTGVTMVALGVLILAGQPWFPAPEVIAVVCWLLILITTLYSGIEYFAKNIGVFKRCP
ncbi:MAG: CDP-diacylglycerol--glycerol-3-phosphate 3-phosphatidyltransferase [Oscillospiraceae bacterium]|jgi:CDP-diacylglycerol--glycerol-3-phosphate 3-phosphatidyltransferase|nr:CDP-diacylglycerol--glycerol-3-phosphate 3-phosphatidyltransferase [Oscillospiraceae bacterium]